MVGDRHGVFCKVPGLRCRSRSISISDGGLEVTVMRGEAATGVGVGVEAGSEAHPLEEFASRLRAGRLRVGLAGGRQQDR